jgi:hypothetical protein
MPQPTITEQKLAEALNEWALKVPGIVLAQTNPQYFAQVLRAFGFEIVPLGALQKVRYEQKTIRLEVTQAWRSLQAATTRLEAMDKREFLQELEPQEVGKAEPVAKKKGQKNTAEPADDGLLK